jgi:hypothetical protein
MVTLKIDLPEGLTEDEMNEISAVVHGLMVTIETRRPKIAFQAAYSLLAKAIAHLSKDGEAMESMVEGVVEYLPQSCRKYRELLKHEQRQTHEEHDSVN